MLKIRRYFYNERHSPVEKSNRIEKDDHTNELYKHRYVEVIAENERLVASNNDLAEKIKSMESLIDTYNKCYLQQTRLKNGKKIAYKEHASCEKVMALLKEGKTKQEVADILGVDRSTIYRRIKEAKKLLIRK